MIVIQRKTIIHQDKALSRGDLASATQRYFVVRDGVNIPPPERNIKRGGPGA
jgi:hypothetical protein